MRLIADAKKKIRNKQSLFCEKTTQKRVKYINQFKIRKETAL